LSIQNNQTTVLPAVPDWTKADYQTVEPFEWLYQYKDNKFVMLQLRDIIKGNAGAVGVKNFVSKWNAFLTDKRKATGCDVENVTEFVDQPVELYCGEYTCDDEIGVTAVDYAGREIVVCRHPIMPVRRLINIDTGEVKIEIAFKRGRSWRLIVFDKGTLASANKIVELSKYGVAVDSESAKYLVSYLTFLEAENYDKIPETNSVGRLGWIAENGFSPYVDSLMYDGDLSYKHMFDSVQAHGDPEKWMELAKSIRASDKLIARIMLAASFASALVEPLGGLPFFVHIWGGTEAGKTVGIMFAASVWANPSMGTYIHTFNSTYVGQEMMAGFCNSLPLCLDELQCIKDRQDFDKLIYMLTEGIGKGRGAKTGGLQRLQTWKNCILTTGEQPISTTSSGGGAVNRIVEIDCKDEKLFSDPQGVADAVRRSYGHAGRVFVEKLSNDTEAAKTAYKQFYGLLSSGDSTEKQSMAGAMILTADKLIDDWIFQDGKTLSAHDVGQYLTSRDDVNANERAYDWLMDFVASNANRFTVSDNFGELWGSIEGDWVYIIKSVFDREMNNAGFNGSSFLSWAKRRYLLDTDPQRTTKKKTIGQTHPRCICIKQQEDSVQSEQKVLD
jgi:uncharacterized protein (DUF927 family)